MRVLFTSSILEHPPAGGPKLRMETSIKALSRVSDLHIVARLPQAMLGGPEGEAYYRTLCRNFSYAPPYAGKPVDIRPWAGRNLPQDALIREIDQAFLLDVVDREGIDFVWFGYGNISFPLIQGMKRARPGLKMIVDTDSVWSRFILRELPFERDPARRAQIVAQGCAKEEEELQWVNLCEATLAVSEVDADYYRSLTTDPSRVHIFTNAIDLRSYEQRPAPPPGFRKPCVYLAGSFGHAASPMDRAARWVVDKVLPRVRAAIPDMHFYIVGSGSDISLADLNGPGVTVTGRLPSVLPYLCNADVALVPLMFESGTRFKIMEGGACEVPMVSTLLGAEGIPVTDGHDILIADEPDDFADAILTLLHDPDLARTMTRRLRALVERRYSVETLTRQAAAILTHVDNAPPAQPLEPVREAITGLTTETPAQLFQRGATLFQAGKIAQSALVWQKLADQEPENPALLTNLGTCLTHLQRWHQAESVFARLARLTPGEVTALFGRGLCAFRQGKITDAIAFWTQVLEIDPNHAQARKNLEIAKGVA